VILKAARFSSDLVFGMIIKNESLPIPIRRILRDEYSSERRIEEIYQNLLKLKKLKSYTANSYSIKHFFEYYLWNKHQQHCYFSNDEAKILMLAAGFESKNKDQINWDFNTSRVEFEKAFPEIGTKFLRRGK
jgi:hypothetical protein